MNVIGYCFAPEGSQGGHRSFPCSARWWGDSARSQIRSWMSWVRNELSLHFLSGSGWWQWSGLRVCFLGNSSSDRSLQETTHEEPLRPNRHFKDTNNQIYYLSPTSNLQSREVNKTNSYNGIQQYDMIIKCINIDSIHWNVYILNKNAEKLFVKYFGYVLWTVNVNGCPLAFLILSSWLTCVVIILFFFFSASGGVIWKWAADCTASTCFEVHHLETFGPIGGLKCFFSEKAKME